MSQFYIASASASAASTPAQRSSSDRYDNYDSDEEDSLPYPGDLPRNDFLAPHFDPQTYLSSLRNRHQTLEDLRSDLRQRSQLLNQELLDLVNGNYEEFLSLGSDLKGGEEKVESVRVGLLGFQREVEGIRKAVQVREEETGRLLEEKKVLRRNIVLGRTLLDVEESIDELEVELGIAEAEGEDLDLELDDEDESGSLDATTRKLQRQVEQYILITRSIERAGIAQPFLEVQQPRIVECRKTLLLDMATALKQAKAAKATETTLDIVNLYAMLGAERSGLQALKGG